MQLQQGYRFISEPSHAKDLEVINLFTSCNLNNKDAILSKPIEPVFFFGSNLAGRHGAGAGAAKYASKYRGAVYGQGEGLTGNSYAIPTKDFDLKSLPIEIVIPDLQVNLPNSTKSLVSDASRVF